MRLQASGETVSVRVKELGERHESAAEDEPNGNSSKHKHKEHKHGKKKHKHAKDGCASTWYMCTTLLLSINASQNLSSGVVSAVHYCAIFVSEALHGYHGQPHAPDKNQVEATLFLTLCALPQAAKPRAGVGRGRARG